MTSLETDLPLPQAAPVAWAPVVRVNLLPPEIFEGRRFKQVQRLLGVAIGAVAVVAGLAVWWAQTGVRDAQLDLDAATAQVSSLNLEKAKYDAVPRVIAQVQAAEAARAKVMGNDILWYRYLQQLAAAEPSGVQITSLAAQVVSPTGGLNATAIVTPLQAVGIGSVTIGGTAPTYPAVSAWLDALGRLPGMKSPTLTNAATGTSTTSAGLDFLNTAVVTTDALSHRYDRTGG